MTTIGDLQQFQPTVFHQDIDGGCASINGILDEFFESMDGSYDDFTSSNLIDDILIKWFDALGRF